MAHEKLTAQSMKRLRRTLSLYWTGLWILGICALAGLAAALGGKLRGDRVDAELSLHAMAAYGLTWFDEDGAFHAELWAADGGLDSGDVDVWVLGGGEPPRVLLAPAQPRFPDVALGGVVQQVIASGEEVFLNARGQSGVRHRLHALPTFLDFGDDTPRAAVVAVSSVEPSRRAQAAFLRQLLLAVVILGAIGIALGVLLARKTVRPVAEALTQRERFLVAAAHELRTPVASMLAVCESGAAGDEAAERALQRAQGIARRTQVVVEDLLLYARLEAGSAELARQPVRLDLLVESCVPESVAVTCASESGHAADVDPKLVELAVRNLVRNALTHGRESDSAGPHIAVEGGTVVVEDGGPGFPSEVLELSRGGYSLAPSAKGSGIGIATVMLVAELHGGELRLENRREGGARATLWLGPAR